MLTPPNLFNKPHNLPSTTQSHAPAEIKQSPLIQYTFMLIGLSLLVFVLHKLDSLLLPLFFSALLSVLLLPLVVKLESRRWPRILAIITGVLLLVGGLAGLLALFGSQLLDLKAELPLIQQKLAVFFDQGQQWLHNRFGMRVMSKDEFLDTSLSFGKRSAGGVLGTTISTTMGVLSVLTLVPIYIFCFLYYRDHMRQFMFRFVAPDKRTTVLHTMDGIQTVVQAYMQGLLTVIVIVAVLNAIGLLVLGVKFALFFAIFASVLAVIPYIGIMIGASVPALITLVETGSIAKAAGVVGVFLVVQFLEGNFITPMVTGSKVSINPMAAIIALILGGELWGTAGMILSIPLVAVLKVVFDANKSLEPWGFLLGDVTDGEETKKDKLNTNPSFLGKAWHMIKRM